MVEYSVHECSEFHSLGMNIKHIKTAAEAVQALQDMPKTQNAVKSISIDLLDEQGEEIETYDVFVGKHFDLSMLPYYQEINNSEEAKAKIKELIALMPECEVWR